MVFFAGGCGVVGWWAVFGVWVMRAGGCITPFFSST